MASDKPERLPRRITTLLAPFVVAGALSLLGLAGLAVVVALAGAAVALLGVVRPPWAARVNSWIAGFGHLVGRGLSTLLLGALNLLVFAPLAGLAKLTGRDPLRGRACADGWQPLCAAERPTARRMFTTEETATKSSWWPRRCALAFVRILGWALIALVLDYTIGWTWDEHFGSHDAGPLRAGDRSHIVQPSQAPAMAAEPWSADLRHEFTALEYEYVPYLQTRVGDVAGRYISSSGGVRRSYQVADLPVDVPEVWFFGGGALWGEGQRDLHTIPSEVARLAEWRGEPIRAANFGQPGYTSWQSALLLEQQLAVRPTPDLVVFYDGADDVAVQVEQVEQPMDRPSHYNVRGANVALLGRDSARDQARGWWEDYSGTSVIGRVLDRFERVLGAMPAAASAPDLGARVAVLHRRSVDLASHVASEHGVAVVFAWQAAEGMSGDGELYRRMVAAQEGVESGVVDLSAALDEVPVPVFLDGVLTNERGAREVAAALWRVVRPHVE